MEKPYSACLIGDTVIVTATIIGHNAMLPPALVISLSGLRELLAEMERRKLINDEREADAPWHHALCEPS